MGRFLFLLPYFMFFLLSHFPYSHTLSLCNHDDQSALLHFKNSFVVNTSYIPPSPYTNWFRCSSFPSKTESWKNGTDCCEWDGVKCDAISGHVIGLDLSCSHLQGEFHPNSTIFKLRHLQQLNLAFNDFSGSSLYPGIGDLLNLTHLNLSHSSFSGDVPSTISHLSKLVSLDLSMNWYMRFFDDVEYVRRMRLDPSTWKKLILNATNLRELHLDGINMSSITERSFSLLTNLSSSLVSLHLSETELQGNLPRDILCLPKLEELDLSINYMLKGQLPKSNWSTHLRYLDLSGTSFSGEIPNSIGHLKYLNHLGFRGCNFDGMVPISLGNLTQLMYLSLGFNINLNGEISSSLFNLTQLWLLDLSENELVGPIPSKITNLSKLDTLDLSNNMLNGTIPHWCYSLPSLSMLRLHGNQLTGLVNEFSSYSLQYLSLSNNKLHGNFPNSIFELENLTVLHMSSTDLSGPLDFHKFSKLKSLSYLNLSQNSFLSINFDSNIDYTLPNLEYLYLSSSNLSSFPQFLEQLQGLQALDLSGNKINGKIPKWFHEKLLHSWKNMYHIDLSFNKLQGDLPIPPSGTQVFLVSNNNFSGEISSTLCDASSLNVLNLAHNNLTGLIPQCLGTFPSLWALDMQMNNFHGSMPTRFSKTNAFETIKLNGNRLQGPFPLSLAHCTNLEVLDLGNNNIQDSFPNWLESLQELQVLSLRSNKLHGKITCVSTKHPFPQLRIFDVSNNNFSGPLPASCIMNFHGMVNVNYSQSGSQYMGNSSYYDDSVVVIMKGQFMELERILTTFTTIDLSNNMFEGEIPKVIGKLNSLKGLNLSHNGITGTIPQSLSDLRNLEWLDLSRNELTGEIPMALTNLNFLSFLNLSQNQLEGIIPTGRQFDTFGNDSYEGNPMLCGVPLSKSCNKDGGQPPHSTFHHEEQESGFGWKSVVVGYACGAVFGMLVGYNVFLTGKPQWLARLVERLFNIRLKRTSNSARANRRGMN